MKKRLQNRLNTHLNLCTKFYSQHFSLCKTFCMNKPLLSGLANLLLCICISDSINVHGALQSAYPGAKPNLHVLGATILMSI